MRLLREELQVLHEPASYVGEVVKVMGKSKVLVKVQPEGKYSESYYFQLTSQPDLMIHFSRRCGLRARHIDSESYTPCSPPLRLVHYPQNPSKQSRPTRITHDGREGTRQHVRDGRRSR